MRNMNAINSLEKTNVTSRQKVLQGLPKNIDASAFLSSLNMLKNVLVMQM